MKRLYPIGLGLLLLVLVNVAGRFVHTRFDLTEDGRYTLSEAAVQATEGLDTPVIIDVLLAGNLPPEFVKLQTETRQLLEEFAAENRNIKFDFVDPLAETDGNPETVIAELQGLGLTPAQVTTTENTTVSQGLVFPWAMVNHKNKTVRVALLKNTLGATPEERINNSVQQLEYAFADAFTKIGLTEKKRLAVIKGNGELDDILIADLLTGLRDYYNIGAITLDSVAKSPNDTFEQLSNYDLALIAKPTEAFTEAEKYVLDQYIVGGGKTVWLIDKVQMELDSLFNETGSAMALPRDLNLDDLLFRYGIRVTPNLVNDLYFTQIVLASGEGNDSQYDPVPWYYHPMVFSSNDHPINNNIEAVRMQFATTLDTLANNYQKTVLLRSSPLSKTDGTPRQISFDIVRTPPDRTTYADGGRPLAVLVEGAFVSAYANRVKPVKLGNAKEQGTENQLLVVADGDVARNQLRQGRPLELGYDKWTNNYYGNKEFLINAINYLLDDRGLINIRNKEVAIPLLDLQKIAEERGKWQAINIGLPILSILLFGLLFGYLRKQKFTR